jgi:tetratricopeptide (TPR) repeat protein
MKGLIVSVWLVGAGLASAQEPPKAQERPEATKPGTVTEEKIDWRTRGSAAEAKGDYAEAAREYQQASREAASQGAPDRAQAEAILHASRALESQAKAEPSSSQELAEARSGYELVIRSGEPDQKLAARNALGVMLLREGQISAALAELKQMDLAAIPSKRSFVFRANLARAYELDGQADQALQEYRKAIEEEPTFPVPRQGALRILAAQRPARVNEGVELVGLLAEGDEPRAAAEMARELVVAWSKEKAATELLPGLATAYVESRTRPSDFEKEEWPALLEALAGPAGPALEQLERAYVDELPVLRGPEEARRLFSEWSLDVARSTAMGQLLRFVSSRDEAAGRFRSALARAWAAWLIDAGETAGALATAGLIQAHPELGQQFPFVLETLVDTLFNEKGAAYQHEDWRRILNLHVVLGGIFEEQGRWEDGPRSAIFQWEHALAADREARMRDPDMGPSPGVHRSMARCYARVGRSREAWDEFLHAAEGFLVSEHIEGSAAMLEEANSLGLVLDGAATSRVRRLEAKIREARSVGGP